MMTRRGVTVDCLPDADKIDPDNEQQHGHERYPALVRSGQASAR